MDGGALGDFLGMEPEDLQEEAPHRPAHSRAQPMETLAESETSMGPLSLPVLRGFLEAEPSGRLLVLGLPLSAAPEWRCILESKSSLTVVIDAPAEECTELYQATAPCSSCYFSLALLDPSFTALTSMRM